MRHHNFQPLRSIVMQVVVTTLLLALPLLAPHQSYATWDEEKKLKIQISNAQERVNAHSLSRRISNLQSFKNRSSWENQWKTARWVVDQLEDAGLEPFIQKYQFNEKTWPNVGARLKGRKNPEQIVMLLAHLDSKAHGGGGIAPGADDNASGVAVLLEIAGILRKTALERSVYFMFFSNEEQNLAGSKHYARLAKRDSLDIRAAINLDVLGYNRPLRPISLEPVRAHSSLKYKAKSIIRMCRNYVVGIARGKDIVKLVGRDANRNLALTTSRIMGEFSGLESEAVIGEDCG